MQPLRTQYSTAVDKDEVRASRYGALNTFQRQTGGPGSIITSEMAEKIKRSYGNEVVMPVLNAQDVTIGNVRSCTVPDSENESALITLTFVTLAFGFTMYPSQHFNNDISYQADWTRKMDKYLVKLAAVLDTMCLDKMNADKNSVWNNITPYNASVGNALQVSAAEQNDFYNQLTSIFEVMDFYDAPYDIVANTMHRPILERLRAQGSGNSTNEAFQFGDYIFNFTNRLSNAPGMHSTLYAMPQGSVAIANRNDPDSIAKSSVGSHKVWGETVLPLVNMNFGTYYIEDCTDASALHEGTAGLTRTKMEGYAFATDVCLISAYNSDPDTRYSRILKTEISNT